MDPKLAFFLCPLLRVGFNCIAFIFSLWLVRKWRKGREIIVIIIRKRNYYDYYFSILDSSLLGK